MIDVAKYQRMIDDSTPGRFEGETAATAYYWYALMNGDGDIIDDDGTTRFDVDREEARAFGLGTPHFYLVISNDGFVYGWGE